MVLNGTGGQSVGVCLGVVTWNRIIVVAHQLMSVLEL